MKAQIPYIGIGRVIPPLLTQPMVGMVEHRYERLHGEVGGNLRDILG
jgi:hypothetical protein